MSKVITVLALSAGGAATYVWLRKNGRTSHLESQIDRVVNKVRGAFTNDDTSNDIAAEVKDKANDVVANVAFEQFEEAGRVEAASS